MTAVGEIRNSAGHFDVFNHTNILEDPLPCSTSGWYSCGDPFRYGCSYYRGAYMWQLYYPICGNTSIENVWNTAPQYLPPCGTPLECARKCHAGSNTCGCDCVWVTIVISRWECN
jgi:hypothetical protein